MGPAIVAGGSIYLTITGRCAPGSSKAAGLFVFAGLPERNGRVATDSMLPGGGVISPPGGRGRVRCLGYNARVNSYYCCDVSTRLSTIDVNWDDIRDSVARLLTGTRELAGTDGNRLEQGSGIKTLPLTRLGDRSGHPPGGDY